MEQSLVHKIAAWTEGQLEEAALVQAIEEAAEVATQHRTGFGTVVEELNPAQQERCADLISFAFSMLDALDNELQEVLDGLESDDRDKVMNAGEMIARASFQLNQCFAEFRNHALAALGPTDIPNLNHIISVKNDFLAEPDEHHRRLFQESIDVERMTTHQGVRDLLKEPQIPEVVALTNSFMAHMANLNRLTEDLEKLGTEADYGAHFMALEMGFRELGDKIPMVNVALRAQGETEFPDLNYLLNTITEAEQGNVSDGVLAQALQTAETNFLHTFETLKAGLSVTESALAKEEIQAAIASFEDFQAGVDAVYRFMVERELIRISQARGFLKDFATRLSSHKEKLKELEALEGKATCPRCSTVNDSDRQRCTSCGFPLPQNVGSTTTTTFQAKEQGGLQTDEPDEDLLLTSNLVKLYEAVNGVHDGSVDDAAFLAEIEKFETLVNASVNTLPAEPTVDAGQQSAVNQVYDAFEEGVELFRQGTEMLRGYLDSRDEDALKQGVKTIDQGAKKVNAAGKAVATATT